MAAGNVDAIPGKDIAQLTNRVAYVPSMAVFDNKHFRSILFFAKLAALRIFLLARIAHLLC